VTVELHCWADTPQKRYSAMVQHYGIGSSIAQQQQQQQQQLFCCPAQPYIHLYIEQGMTAMQTAITQQHATDMMGLTAVPPFHFILNPTM